MTGLTVIGFFFGVQPVFLHPHRAMVRGNLIGAMTTIAVLDIHLSIVLMGGQRPGFRSKTKD